MAFRSGVAPRASSTWSQMPTEFSTSVPEKLSGEYSYRMDMPGSWRSMSSVKARIRRAPSTAMWMTPCMSVSKTTFRWRVEVEL
ncbi:unknown [Firmicutes bacterium CAG:94]|nr:unknown [Firmicutes bacterium CAG:94]